MMRDGSPSVKPYLKNPEQDYLPEVFTIKLDFDPTGLPLYTYHARNDNSYYVKNIRVAEGGVKYYDRFLQEERSITGG